MKTYLTTLLLCVAIVLISLGTHTNNIIFLCIGGGLAGIYNSIIYKED